MSENSTVQNMRELIADFKRSYVKVTEHAKGDDMQNVEDVILSVRKKLDELYINLVNHIKSEGGVPPQMDDDTKLTYFAFENYGITSGIREDPSLKESLLYYAKLDLRTYPFTLDSSLIDAHNYKRTPQVENVVANRIIN